MPKQSNAERRKRQNREAQRRFRQKQARLARESKQNLEDLESRYEALLASSSNPAQQSAESVPGSLTQPLSESPADSNSTSPVCANDEWAAATSELSLEPFYAASDGVGTAASAPVLECASPSVELDTLLELAPGLEDSQPLAPETGVVATTDAKRSEPGEPTPLLLPDCSPFPGAYPSCSSTDVVQAIVQILYTQERIAQIELQKLRIMTQNSARGFFSAGVPQARSIGL